MDGTILVADDDRAVRIVLSQALTRAGCKVHATASAMQLLRWVREGRGDVVVTDVMMPDGNGLDLVPQIRDARADLPVIVVSAQNTINTAIRAEAVRAFDYIPKPFDIKHLLSRIRDAQAHGRDLRGAVAPVVEEKPNDAELPLIGRSSAMQKLYKSIAKLLHSDLPVLLTGESGTGKSLIAQVIHEASDRRAQRMLVLRPADVVDSGALEAVGHRIGTGTIVLENLGNLSAEAQQVLLGFIDTLGESGPRLVGISDSDAVKNLRPELYFRLAAITVAVPPLRARSEDIELHLRDIWGEQVEVDYEALDMLRTYPWPGNLRQLSYVAHGLAGANMISAEMVREALAGQPMTQQNSEGLRESISGHLQEYFSLHGDGLPPAGLHKRLMCELEVPLIEICLDATGGNQVRTAELLGLNRNTLRKKISDYGILVAGRRRLM